MQWGKQSYGSLVSVALRKGVTQHLDEDVADALVLGESIDDHLPPAVNSLQHAQTAIKLGVCKSFCLRMRQLSIMHRYFLAMRERFSKTAKLSIVVDGSRIKIERFCGAVGGYSDGDFYTAWLPPQARPVLYWCMGTRTSARAPLFGRSLSRLKRRSPYFQFFIDWHFC